MTATLSPRWLDKYKGLTAPRRSKYGAQKVVTFDSDGNRVTIDSKLEARRYAELQLMERAGEISNLRRQVPFRICNPANGEPIRYVDSKRPLTYVCDHVYERGGVTVYEDAKGVAKREYLIKKALLAALHGIKLTEYRRRKRK